MKNNFKKKVLMLIIVMSITSGCSKYDFKVDFMDAPLGAYINNHDDISKFSDVYEAWKYDIDTLYVQVGIDDYTECYLLEKMPYVFSTLINASKEYDMNVYALLDGDIWFTENNEGLLNTEITNILSYNKKQKNKRFHGININMNLIDDDIKLNNYINNLKKVRNIIDIHNKSCQDNLLLSTNINSKILNNTKYIDKILNLVDKISFDSQAEDIMKNGETILSILDNYDNKKVAITLDYNNKDIFNLKPIKLMNNIDKLYDKFNKYKSFDGFIISNYKEYISYVKKIKP